MTNKVRNDIKPGLDFKANNSPGLIDLLERYDNGHIAIFATNQSGRDALVLDILAQAISAKIPVFALEHKRSHSISPLERFTRRAEGLYVNALDRVNRFFELPDFGYLQGDQEEALHFFIEKTQETLLGFIFIDRKDLIHIEIAKLILRIALENFYLSQSTYFDLANDEKCLSNAPSLKDFLPFCSPVNIENARGLSAIIDENFKLVNELIYSCLSNVIEGKIGQASTSTKTDDKPAQIKVYAVEQAEDVVESLRLHLLAHNLMLCDAESCRSSVMFIDDVSNLCRSDILSEQLARLCANGAKYGVQVILRSNEVDTIAQSKYGRRILENIKTNLIGYLQSAEVDAFERVLNIPPVLIERNDSLTYKPNEEYSNWLLHQNGVSTSCQHRPSKSSLKLAAAVGANPFKVS